MEKPNILWSKDFHLDLSGNFLWRTNSYDPDTKILVVDYYVKATMSEGDRPTEATAADIDPVDNITEIHEAITAAIVSANEVVVASTPSDEDDYDLDFTSDILSETIDT